MIFSNELDSQQLWKSSPPTPPFPQGVDISKVLEDPGHALEAAIDEDHLEDLQVQVQVQVQVKVLVQVQTLDASAHITPGVVAKFAISLDSPRLETVLDQCDRDRDALQVLYWVYIC